MVTHLIVQMLVLINPLSQLLYIFSLMKWQPKPAYWIRDYCQSKLRKLSRKSEFLYTLYSLFDWTKLGIKWWNWYINMGYNVVLLYINFIETNRKENLDLPLNLQTAQPMLCRTNRTQLTRLLLQVYHS